MRQRILSTTVLLIVLAAPAYAQVGIQGNAWFPIGPAPMSGFFSGGVSGRASALAVNPTNPDDIWLGTANGGVWHSTDNGGHWRLSTELDGFAPAIGSIELTNCTPTGCEPIYVGTGEDAIRRDTYHGIGLLVGETRGSGEFRFFGWELDTGAPNFNFKFGSINKVLHAADAPGGPALYIALSSGTTTSATESTVTAPTPSPGGFGLYKRQGGVWSKLAVAGAEGLRATDIERHPTNPSVLYAGFLGRGVFKSTDAGASWCPLNPGVPLPAGCTATSGFLDVSTSAIDHVEISLAPGNANVIYARLGACPDRLLQSCEPWIYRSNDGGANWELRRTAVSTDITSTTCPRSYSRYTHGLAVHPDDSDVLFFAGLRICKSADGGQTFSQADVNTAGADLHLDHHSIVIHPLDHNRMYDTSDGGVAVSSDAGASWTHKNDGLQTFGFQTIASSPLTGRVIGASQDNSGQLWKGSRVWNNLPCCGDGGFSIMDRDDAMKMYIASQQGALSRSTDGGVSFGGATSGIVASEPRAFYTPFVQDPTPPHPLYGGTNRLYRSGNDAVSWSPVTTSALSSATNTEIVGGQDVITAIAVAPSNPSQIYIGYYGGRVFTTSSGSDPWTEVTAAAFPAAPVTWLAVDPQDASRAYVTFSGFGSGAHVFRTTTAGGAWQAIGTGLPAGLPANTISVEPGTAANLWLGTDQGVYKSTNGGDGWTKFSLGLPNAPVYEISIDETHGRVYAATHGRGAFVLGRPFLSNFEGWVHGGIWDIPVYGQNFLPNQSCTLTLLRQDGTVCSTGSVDAMGGTISTDSNGVLVTSLASFYSGKPVAWACFNGKCLNNSDISQCNLPAAPITTVLANCGGQLGIDHVTGCPQISNPPSTLLGLSGLPDAPAAQASEGAETRAPDASLAADQAFDLTASVQAGDGTTRSLCSVRVTYQRGESSDAVLQRAKDALNASPECVAQQVTAEIHPRNDRLGEDDFFVAPKLLLRAPGVSGGQLVTSLHAGPGTAAGTCFELHGIGVPVTNQIEILRLRFETLAGGADGGEIRLHQASGQGDCTLRLPTTPGQSAAEIAQALVNASQATGIPGPHPECPAERNPRDLTFDNGTVITVFSSALAVCLDDPSVGISVRPEEMPNAHPVADAGPDRVIDCSRQDGLDVTLDGRASSDADSVPGTRSDIVRYEWFEDFGLPGQRALGMGDVLTVRLSLGTHRITLRVTDAAGTSSVDTATIVLRSTPPVFTFVPPAITISSCKRPNIGQATATAPCPVTVTNNAPTVFPLGTTVVTWTARNTAGDVVTATQAVTAILGDDASCCPAGSNVVLGTANADVLVGTAGRDCILGRGGNDIIVGAGADDALSGGAGDDTLRGDEGNDQLYGGPGRDILAGVFGNDLLLGGDGDDQLDGGDGNDRLLGEAGNDQLNGGRGTNVLNGGNGTDACQGVRGVDQFVSCESIP